MERSFATETDGIVSAAVRRARIQFCSVNLRAHCREVRECQRVAQQWGSGRLGSGRNIGPRASEPGMNLAVPVSQGAVVSYTSACQNVTEMPGNSVGLSSAQIQSRTVTVVEDSRGASACSPDQYSKYSCQEPKRSHEGLHAHSPRKRARCEFEPVRISVMPVNDTQQWNFGSHS